MKFHPSALALSGPGALRIADADGRRFDFKVEGDFENGDGISANRTGL